MALSPQIVHLLKRASEQPSDPASAAPPAPTPPGSDNGSGGFVGLADSVGNALSNWWSKPENQSLAKGVGLGVGVSAAAVLAAILLNRARRRGF